MDFTAVINDLQGRASALLSVIETLKMLQAGDVALKLDAEVVLPPPVIQDPHPTGKKPTRKTKVICLAKKANSSGGGNKRAAILEYLRQHPGSGAVVIAKALGFSRSATTWNLAEARDASLVKIEGRSSNAKWSLVKQDANAKTPLPRDQEEPESKLECKFCHAPCASPDRLQRHMSVVHGKSI